MLDSLLSLPRSSVCTEYPTYTTGYTPDAYVLCMKLTNSILLLENPPSNTRLFHAL